MPRSYLLPADIRRKQRKNAIFTVVVHPIGWIAVRCILSPVGADDNYRHRSYIDSGNDRDRLLTGRFLWIFYTKSVHPIIRLTERALKAKQRRSISQLVWLVPRTTGVAVCFRYSVQYFVEKLMKFDDYHGSNRPGDRPTLFRGRFKVGKHLNRKPTWK